METGNMKLRVAKDSFQLLLTVPLQHHRHVTRLIAKMDKVMHIRMSMNVIFSKGVSIVCLPRVISFPNEMGLLTSSLPPSNRQLTKFGTCGPVFRCIDQASHHNTRASYLSATCFQQVQWPVQQFEGARSLYMQQ